MNEHRLAASGRTRVLEPRLPLPSERLEGEAVVSTPPTRAVLLSVARRSHYLITRHRLTLASASCKLYFYYYLLSLSRQFKRTSPILLILPTGLFLALFPFGELHS